MGYYHGNRKRGFDFGDFEITKREILASVSIIAVMLLIGVLISGKISEYQMDKNEIYNKAVKIQSSDIFAYGMRTNVGNAFVYGDLKAVDTVTYPEIGGEYMYVEKVEERYERHEEYVTEEDDEGNKHRKLKVWYEWEVENRGSQHSSEISFLDISFPYEKIRIPTDQHITTIEGDKVWSWESGERVKVRFCYYGVATQYTGTIFTELKNNTISDNTPFYENKTIDETVELLESNGGTIIFWVLWIIFIGVCVYGFYYLDNRWLD